MSTVFDARGQVTAGYVKAAGLTVVPLALLAAWLALALGARAELDGYALRTDWLVPFRIALLAFLVLAGAQLVAALRERHRAAVLLGLSGSVVGAAALATLAALVAAPT